MEKLNLTDPNATPPEIETVLVIDDDESWCFISKRILQKAGVGKQILTAQNGLEAINKLQHIAQNGQKLPELIFLDLKMPVMDGFEFLETIHTSPDLNLNLNYSRIFVCSSSLLSQDKERVKGFGVAGFIPKPITPEILNSILR